MSELESLRNELQQINLELFKLIKRRRDIGAQIQSLKSSQSKPTYDPNRELSLFKQNGELYASLSLGELGVFSLLMETQAGGDYPEWSKGAHLVDTSNAPCLNPLMLLLFYPEKIMVDDLKSEFKNLVQLAEG